MKNHILIAGLALFSVANYAAKFQGSIRFTSSEKAQHVQDIDVIGRYTKSCMFKMINKHRSWIKDYGISPYYGDQSSFAKNNYYIRERKNVLKKMSLNPALYDEMEPTSCVGFVLKCVGEGFEKAGQEDLWEKIKVFTKKNGQRGTALIHGLEKIGWNISYWNADPSKNGKWDFEENFGGIFAGRAYRGQHRAMYNSVMKRNIYYTNTVHDKTSLVGFKRKIPKKVTDAPFFVGMSHIGFHVFAGGHVTYAGGKNARGILFEGHSSRKITDPDTIEMRKFDPIKWKYKSGLMAFPPKK